MKTKLITTNTSIGHIVQRADTQTNSSTEVLTVLFPNDRQKSNIFNGEIQPYLSQLNLVY